MKKLVFLLVLTLIFSCSNNDNGSSDNVEDYRVTQVIYHGGGGPVAFGDNDMMWSFNFSSNVLTVENNVHGDHPGTIPSGTYDFTFENNIITLDYSDLNYSAEFDLSNNDTVLTLFFDLIIQAVDDEVSYVFARIEL